MHRSIKASRTEYLRFPYFAKFFLVKKLFFPILTFFFLFFLFISSNSYADEARIIETLPDGLVIQFDMSELKSEQKEIDERIFDDISFESCTFTHEYGRPKVPIYATILGIPEHSSPTISILSDSYNLVNDHNLQIIRNEETNASESSISSESPIQSNSFYPPYLARIVPIGYMRQQRIARLELYPAQYNQRTKQLRVYKRLQVKVSFGSLSQPSSYANY